MADDGTLAAVMGAGLVLAAGLSGCGREIGGEREVDALEDPDCICDSGGGRGMEAGGRDKPDAA